MDIFSNLSILEICRNNTCTVGNDHNCTDYVQYSKCNNADSYHIFEQSKSNLSI